MLCCCVAVRVGHWRPSSLAPELCCLATRGQEDPEEGEPVTRGGGEEIMEQERQG